MLLHRGAMLRAALLLPLFAVAVAAEEARPPDPAPEPPARSKLWAAPVGHRQPRASDVATRSVKDDFDQRLEQIERGVEQQLQICRRC